MAKLKAGHSGAVRRPEGRDAARGPPPRTQGHLRHAAAGRQVTENVLVTTK